MKGRRTENASIDKSRAREELQIAPHRSNPVTGPTTKIISIVSHRTQREYGLAPSGQLPHRRGGHALSLAGFANSIRGLHEKSGKCL
jgi:hypothetical protein